MRITCARNDRTREQGRIPVGGYGRRAKDCAPQVRRHIRRRRLLRRRLALPEGLGGEVRPGLDAWGRSGIVFSICAALRLSAWGGREGVNGQCRPWLPAPRANCSYVLASSSWSTPSPMPSPWPLPCPGGGQYAIAHSLLPSPLRSAATIRAGRARLRASVGGLTVLLLASPQHLAGRSGTDAHGHCQAWPWDQLVPSWVPLCALSRARWPHRLKTNEQFRWSPNTVRFACHCLGGGHPLARCAAHRARRAASQWGGGFHGAAKGTRLVEAHSSITRERASRVRCV